MAPDNAQEPMDPGDLECKHKVFLCHSGAQKGFVEQLDKDLRSVDRYPFFDKDRKSLPIGDNFPSLIFEAIERCQVGVVFLSEEFFVRSHWPMFEVVRMVECGRKIMPIFLGISPGDLSNVEKVAEWKSKWEVWAKSNGRIDVARWESTLGSLRKLNGLVYKDAIGEVQFRKEIVEEVCKVVPPFHVWDDSHVQGKFRISKLMQVKISETQMSKKGVQVVGLYGVGGIGKTTACKSLCTDLLAKFDGRVCHIEFGGDTSKIDRVREVLKRLTNTGNEFLKGGSLEECWSRMKDVLRSSKVALAIDNVSDNSKIHEEAQEYLRLEYGKGSVVMVTARALGELEKLGIKSDNCLAMPELVEEEARALFAFYAEPMNGVDDGVIMEYVNRCLFWKGDGEGSKHYHPLTLRVLGSQMVGKSPSEWKSQLGEEDIFNQLGEEDHPVFSILRWSFDSLRNEYKMMFMDVALFDDGRRLFDDGRRLFDDGRRLFDDGRRLFDDGRRLFDDGYEFKKLIGTFSEFDTNFGLRFINDQGYTIFEWLSIVHGISMEEVKKRLNVLKKKALLEELGDGTNQIGMHDLWREFAIMETKRGEEEELQWVYEKHVSRGERHAKSCMCGGGWEKLRRIFIQESELGSINFSKCMNVTVLRLVNVYVENGVLDLSHLKSIRTLEIVHHEHSDSEDDYDDLDDDQYESEDDPHDSKDDHRYSEDDHHDSEDDRYDSGSTDVEDQKHIQVSGIGQLLNLTALIWLNIDHESMSAMEEISCLTNLQILHLKCDYDSNCMSLDLKQLRYLQEVSLEVPGMVSILGFSSRMKGLRILDLVRCRQLRSCAGVGDVDGLEALLLRGCSGLEELPDLRKLRRLRILDIHGCELLKALPGLGCLGTLQALHGDGACLAMKELPSMSKLAKLEELDLSRCYKLKCIPGLGNLVALRELWVFCGSLHGLPDRGNLRRLQKVRIYGSSSGDCKADCGVPGSVLNLAMFESVSTLEIVGVDHELSKLSKLTALKSLKLRVCTFERLPHMGSDMILETLWIHNCELRGWDVVRGLGAGPASRVDTSSDWTLPYLKEIVVRYCRIFELPDLRHFPQLRELSVYGWDYLDSMSEKLVVHCHAIHVHLETLRIKSVAIEELPDLGNFPSLRCVEIECCYNLTNLTISEPLSALSRLVLRLCRNLRTVPNINIFPRLTEFSFEFCGVRLNEHEVQKLIDRGFDRGLSSGIFYAERSSNVLPPTSE